MNDQQTKELLCELLGVFYEKNWVSGTGGGICGPTEDGNIFLAPTGVHKERVRPDDFFVINPADCAVVRDPANPGLKPSECNPIFSAIVRTRGARSVVHSHALSSVLLADVWPKRDHAILDGFEMLKGIRGLGNTDQHLVPIIRNTPREADLVEQVQATLDDHRFQGAFCILVRDHGAYIWGEDIWEAKRHTEVYHWLFEGLNARASRKG